MRTYFDTSLLLATYLPEPETDAALEILYNTSGPVPFSHLWKSNYGRPSG